MTATDIHSELLARNEKPAQLEAKLIDFYDELSFAKRQSQDNSRAIDFFPRKGSKFKETLLTQSTPRLDYFTPRRVIIVNFPAKFKTFRLL